MRQCIIEALTYPRIALLSNLKGKECPQHQFFSVSDEGCHYCEQGRECQWLSLNDEFTVLAQKPMDSLYESLQFCIDYIDTQCVHSNHNVRRCACESCQWVRSARQLASDYRHRRPSH